MKPLVVFDMNGVLGVRARGEFTPFPGVARLLSKLQTESGVDVGIWSSGRPDVVNRHVSEAFPDVSFTCVFSRANVPGGDTKVKPFSVLATCRHGRERPSAILMVDDSPKKLASWPSSQVLVVDRSEAARDPTIVFSQVQKWVEACVLGCRA